MRNPTPFGSAAAHSRPAAGGFKRKQHNKINVSLKQTFKKAESRCGRLTEPRYIILPLANIVALLFYGAAVCRRLIVSQRQNDHTESFCLRLGALAPLCVCSPKPPRFFLALANIVALLRLERLHRSLFAHSNPLLHPPQAALRDSPHWRRFGGFAPTNPPLTKNQNHAILFLYDMKEVER